MDKELENKSAAGDIKEEKERAKGRDHVQAGVAATKDQNQKLRAQSI